MASRPRSWGESLAARFGRAPELGLGERSDLVCVHTAEPEIVRDHYDVGTVEKVSIDDTEAAHPHREGRRRRVGWQELVAWRAEQHPVERQFRLEAGHSHDAGRRRVARGERFLEHLAPAVEEPPELLVSEPPDLARSTSQPRGQLERRRRLPRPYSRSSTIAKPTPPAAQMVSRPRLRLRRRSS